MGIKQFQIFFLDYSYWNNLKCIYLPHDIRECCQIQGKMCLTAPGVLNSLLFRSEFSQGIWFFSLSWESLRDQENWCIFVSCPIIVLGIWLIKSVQTRKLGGTHITYLQLVVSHVRSAVIPCVETGAKTLQSFVSCE